MGFDRFWQKWIKNGKNAPKMGKNVVKNAENRNKIGTNKGARNLTKWDPLGSPPVENKFVHFQKNPINSKIADRIITLVRYLAVENR